MADPVNNFVEFYQGLGVGKPVLLNVVYDDDIEFIDPVHRMQGLDALQQYFDSLMQNVLSLKFQITDSIASSDQAHLQWVMSYSHPKLASGKVIDVNGVSHIRFHNKVFYHRDFYDLGEMLYEHVPVYGWFTRQLKSRLAG